MSYAIDAVDAVQSGTDAAELVRPLLIVSAFTVGSLVVAALTLRRRTP